MSAAKGILPQTILLNGPSSAGKSSIAEALRRELLAAGTPAVVVSLDNHLRMTPEAPIWEDDVYAVSPAMGREIAQALKRGETVIVDHVITSSRIYAALVEAAVGFPLRRVLVSCGVETLRRREAARGNRCPGSAEASLRYLFPSEDYDLRLNSDTATPAALASAILTILQT